MDVGDEATKELMSELLSAQRPARRAPSPSPEISAHPVLFERDLPGSLGRALVRLVSLDLVGSHFVPPHLQKRMHGTYRRRAAIGPCTAGPTADAGAACAQVVRRRVGAGEKISVSFLSRGLVRSGPIVAPDQVEAELVLDRDCNLPENRVLLP